jgi:hypothetical protein
MESFIGTGCPFPSAQVTSGAKASLCGGCHMTAGLFGQVRTICLALPEVTERLSHGAPTWFVRGKSAFVTLWAGAVILTQLSH